MTDASAFIFVAFNAPYRIRNAREISVSAVEQTIHRMLMLVHPRDRSRRTKLSRS